MKPGVHDLLEALLFKRRVREAFFAGDTGALGASPEDLDSLRAMDPTQLALAATLTREHVMTRSHRGSGRLVDAFRATIAAWRRDHPRATVDDLACDFLESGPFEAYRAHPFAGPGICVEEAFLRFADQASVGEAAVRMREGVTAVLRVLAVTPEPLFAIPAFLRRAPKGYFAILPAGPTLLGVLGGRFVEGVITPSLVSVLDALARGADVSSQQAPDAVVDELVRLGLLEKAGGSFASLPR